MCVVSVEITRVGWRLRLWILNRAAAWCGLVPYAAPQSDRAPRFVAFAQSKDLGTAALLMLADRVELERQQAAIAGACAASAERVSAVLIRLQQSQQAWRLRGE